MLYHLAIDIGASSGRHVLGWIEQGRIKTQEIYRFENVIQDKNGVKCWDIDTLYDHVVAGLAECKKQDKIPETLGIDTWAVDYVLLDAAGNRLGEAVCYRDSRTEGMDNEVERSIPFAELYEATGIQKQPFNTVYQLMADMYAEHSRLEHATQLLMIPEYLNYRLTGIAANEYTNATSTALVNAKTKAWDTDLIQRLGFPQKLFGALHTPGDDLGPLTAELQTRLGFNCKVVLPTTHDTGSAFLAVPAKDENAVYLSSGTWSLLGVENTEPVLTEAARLANFTNEGGYQYRYRFLKNIMGLWMIQSIRHDLDKKYSFAELEAMARQASGFPSRVDVNAPCFLSPDSMIAAIKEACHSSGQLVPETAGQIMECVYQSLAASYAVAVKELEKVTGKSYASLNIVGGGSKDCYLNQLTANATGLPVYAGPTEGTVIGNLLVQFLASTEFADLQTARKAVAASFEVKEYTSNNQRSFHYESF